jgi:microcystin-dependent protein
MPELIKRRSFLFGLGVTLCAPAVVKAASLMPISSAKLILPPTEIIGAIKANVGPIPDGWIVCDGGWRIKREYSDLYGVIGDTYGATQDAFYLPDLMAQAARDRDNGVYVGRYVIYGGNQETDHRALLNQFTATMHRQEAEQVATIDGEHYCD